MSVVGFDFGNLSSKIAVARNRGVDVICNEVSNRATPTLVSFGTRSRYIGEAAKTQEVGNFRNTTFSIKRLLGASINDISDLQHEKKFFSSDPVQVDDNGVGFRVTYLDEEHVFSVTELVGMLLARLREITEVDVGRSVHDIVLSVPVYYTDRQRRALLDAASIAGINCLRLVNECTAVALAWGMPKADTFSADGTHRLVCFVDIGHASTSVCIGAFTKTRADIKAVAWNRCLGGRDFDDVLAQHVATQLATQAKSPIDVRGNKRAMLRLRSAAERTKKVLSANAVTRLAVEALQDDRDVAMDVTRETFESLIGHLLQQIEKVVLEALQRASLSPEAIDSVEIVGGSTRIPAVKTLLTSIFGGRSPATTLNQDEAVCRGAALLAAMVSPVFRVREYTVHDCVSMPVQFTWPSDSNGKNDNSIESVDVFPQGNVVPSTKLLTFDEPNLPISITCKYADVNSLPSTDHVLIGTADVNGTVSFDKWEAKVKVRANPSGLFNIESANAISTSDPVTNDDQQKGEQSKPEQKSALSVEWKPSGHLSKEALDALCEAESQMHANDRLIAETADRRNALEEYIYDIRGKLESTLIPFIAPNDAQKLSEMLRQTESWLYEDGVDAGKSVYADRLEMLKALGEPAKLRARQSEDRPRAVERLRTTIGEITARLSETNGLFTYASDADKAKLFEEVAKKQSWLESQLQAQSALPNHVPPVLTDTAIDKQQGELASLAANISAKAQRAQKESIAKQQKTSQDTATKTDECCSSNSASTCHKEAQECCNNESCCADEPPNMQVD